MNRRAVRGVSSLAVLVAVLCSFGQTAPEKKAAQQSQAPEESGIPLAARFENVGSFSEGLAPVMRAGKWGYVDKDGRMVIAPKFEHADRFSENLAGVSLKEEKYGYIGRDGSWAINPQFEAGQAFSDGGAAVRLEKKWGFIKTTGEFLAAPRYSAAWRFTEGLALVLLDGKFGYIDRSGQLAVQPKFLHACPFSEGLAAVGTGKDTGFIDKGGAFVIRPRFLSFECPLFSEGKAPVGVPGKGFGHIDRTGKLVIAPNFTCTGNFSEGLAVAGTAGRCAHNLLYFSQIDSRDPGFLSFLNVAEDPHQSVYSMARFGFIDGTGTAVVFSTQFTEVGARFSEGLGAVKLDTEWGFVGRDGRFVIKPRFERAFGFSQGFAAVVLGGSAGFIDNAGRWLTTSAKATQE